jgi:DNA (cytosine-5)-methyltransferase 1
MRCFSLFSGIGGFDLAMRNLGHEVVGACEIDRYARSVYGRHFPGVPIWEDATKINPSEIPDFDILVAGFPCQAFSIAGKRLGFEESRGTLFFEIVRIVKQKRPRLLLLENVKGLLSHDRGKTFANILATLDELGYDAEWQVLNSKYFVPQNRERIFIVGHLRGEGGRQVFPLGENDTKVIGENNLMQLNTTDHDTGRIYHPDGLARSLRANSGGMGSKTGLYAVVNDHGVLKEREISNNLHPNYWKGMDNHAQRTMIAWSKSHRPHGIESRIKIGEANTLNTGNGCQTQSSATFVMLTNKNSNTKQRVQDREKSWCLGSKTDFGIKDGTRIRRLTPLECERLQGFPDNYTRYGKNGEEISDTQRYRMCGNAVTVPVVEYIGEKL